MIAAFIRTMMPDGSLCSRLAAEYLVRSGPTATTADSEAARPPKQREDQYTWMIKLVPL